MKKVEVIKSYYEANMRNGAPDYSILGWESAEAQNLRFDAFSSNVTLDGRRLLDVGCGLGNLLEHLNGKNTGVEYTGVDILPDMIEMAKRKNLNGKFLCADIFDINPFQKGEFDAVYSSGIFNINLGNNRDFLTRAVSLFLDLSTEIVAFSLLHHNSPNREEQYFYFAPDEVVKLLSDKFENRIEQTRIVEGYLQNDFTVICRKKGI